MVGVRGEVGNRLFLLQVREGRRLVIVKCEKLQLSASPSGSAQVIADPGSTRRTARRPRARTRVRESDFVAGDIAVAIDEEAQTIEVTFESAERRGHAWSDLTASGPAAWPSPSRDSSRPGRPTLPALRRTARPRGHDCPAHERPRAPDPLRSMNRDEQRTLLSQGIDRDRGRVVGRPTRPARHGHARRRRAPRPVTRPRPASGRSGTSPTDCGAARSRPTNSTSALGRDLVPTTVATRGRPFGIGSLQWWVDDNEEDHYFTLRERPEFATGSPSSRPSTSWPTTPTASPATCSWTGRAAGRSTTACASTRTDKLRTVIWEYAGLTRTSLVRLERSEDELATLSPSELARAACQRALSATRRGPRLAALPLAA
jgi:hypothetical protein